MTAGPAANGGQPEASPAHRLVLAVAVPQDLRAIAFSAAEWQRLQAAADVRTAPGDPRSAAAFASLIADARAVLVSWGCPALSAEVLAAAPGLALLANLGGSVKPFVTRASWDRPVRVTQAGDAMSRAVAEACLAMTLSLLHRIGRSNVALHNGAAWQLVNAAPPRHELLGSTIGVVGASRTGRVYIDLVQKLGGHVIVTDPYLSPADADKLGVTGMPLRELLATARVVALHAPALPETRLLIGARELALMADGAILVNTARSWLVDEAALTAELRAGRLDAGLDVFDQEPLPADHELRTLPNVILNPHMAGGTVEARFRQGALIVDEITRFVADGTLAHEVHERDLARMG